MSQKVQPEVSILITVYNHEKFIRQCLDSIVSQVTDFPFEIVIGEDCSPDSSREIVIEYAKKYPEIIVPILYEQNQGTKKCPGKGNFTNTFYQCKGKYIVHIEADDYLTDNKKLQIQYDYLNANPTISACFHNALVIYDENLLPPTEVNPHNQKVQINTEDFLVDKEVWFMATASVMFRRESIPQKFPEWFMNCKSGDIPLYCMLSSRGNINYIPKTMSVYRKHAGGLSFTDVHQDINFIKNRIFTYQSINLFLNKKYDNQIKKIVAKYNLSLADSLQYGNNPIIRIFYTLKSILISRPENLFETFKNYGISKINYDKYLQLRRWINSIFNK
jgi:glycosyltransferase involved in cell wall biosynthesis